MIHYGRVRVILSFKRGNSHGMKTRAGHDHFEPNCCITTTCLCQTEDTEGSSVALSSVQTEVTWLQQMVWNIWTMCLSHQQNQPTSQSGENPWKWRSRWILAHGAASAVRWTWYGSVVVHRELRWKAKLSIYPRSILHLWPWGFVWRWTEIYKQLNVRDEELLLPQLLKFVHVSDRVCAAHIRQILVSISVVQLLQPLCHISRSCCFNIWVN